jgi:hypothetical protein
MPNLIEIDEEEESIKATFTKSQSISEKTAIKEGEKTFEELVPEEFRDYKDVFSKKASERLPIRRPEDHAIDLEEEKKRPYAKIYDMGLKEKKALDEYLDENLTKGYIRESTSSMAAPVFFIKKKDGALRLVVDYRKLNEITIS